MKTFKLHLIRHGLTQGNLDGIYMGGGLDQPLCPQGTEALQKLKTRYRYPVVGTLFCSPMQRALQSAEILFPDVPDRYVLEDLRENRFGEFEGRSADELMQDKNFTRWLDPQSVYVPKGGESGTEFAQRTLRALVTMLTHLSKHNIAEAACVTHGGVIMSQLSQMGMPRKPYPEWLADNGCGFTVQTSASMLMRDGLVEVVDIVPQGYLTDA